MEEYKKIWRRSIEDEKLTKDVKSAIVNDNNKLPLRGVSTTKQSHEITSLPLVTLGASAHRNDRLLNVNFFKSFTIVRLINLYNL